MPANEVNPAVVEVMREKGIDLSGNTPELITNQMVQEADMIIVMGCSLSAIYKARWRSIPFFSEMMLMIVLSRVDISS